MSLIGAHARVQPDTRIQCEHAEEQSAPIRISILNVKEPRVDRVAVEKTTTVPVSSQKQKREEMQTQYPGYVFDFSQQSFTYRKTISS